MSSAGLVNCFNDPTHLLDLNNKSDQMFEILEQPASETDQTHPNCFTKNKRKLTKIHHHLPDVQAFLYETGLDAQLIDKNDKKLIKLNHAQCPKPRKFLYNLTPASSQQSQSSTLRHFQSSIQLDDLPSESDISTGSILVIPPNPNTKPVIPTIKLFAQHKNVAFRYKCTLCSGIFDNESTFKTHQKVNCFDQQETEARNEKKHHLQQQQVGFICNTEDYSSNTSHMNKNKMEQDSKPFKCRICSFEFTRASNLRAHLLKVHSNDIGKLVTICKSDDNKLRFEFDRDRISQQKETQRQAKTADMRSLTCSGSALSTNISVSGNDSTGVYNKETNDKNAVNMTFYVDDKPDFVESPKPVATEPVDDSLSTLLKARKHSKPEYTKKGFNKHTLQRPLLKVKQPVAKIPYLLAAAAAAAASNHHQQHYNMQKYQQQNSRIISDNDRFKKPQSGTSSNFVRDLKQDQEYMQLVSMLKQKNEKLLFDPQILNLKSC